MIIELSNVFVPSVSGLLSKCIIERNLGKCVIVQTIHQTLQGLLYQLNQGSILIYAGDTFYEVSIQDLIKINPQ